MRLEAGIAWRYLWKKKSHGALSAIAVVSVVGVAVATAALICVLSVFNGFRNVLAERNDLILPDIEVTPAAGKAIEEADSLAAAIAAITGVEIASPAIADQALAICGRREMPVMLRGVDPQAFRRYTAIDSLIAAGVTIPSDAPDYDTPAGLVAIGVASRLQMHGTGEEIFLFAPRREGRINVANPMASFHTDSITAVGIVETLQSDYDASSVIVPIEVARGLLQYDTQASLIAVSTVAGADPENVARDIEARLGARYVVKDRMRQQEINFRMVQIEKWVTGLLLVFILIIASFNIISTMTMFVLEKRRQISIFRALGMERGAIGRIFGWESMYITLLGAIGGTLCGILLCVLQQRYGLILMAGDADAMIIEAYPVEFMWSDLRMVAVPVLLIGAFTAWTAAAFARSRIGETRQ